MNALLSKLEQGSGAKAPTRRELRQLFSQELLSRQLEIDRSVAVNSDNPFKRAVASRLSCQPISVQR